MSSIVGFGQGNWDTCLTWDFSKLGGLLGQGLKLGLYNIYFSNEFLAGARLKLSR